MGIIQCAEGCKFQLDGYCQLDKPSEVGSLKSDCPYYIPASFDYRNSLTEAFDTDKLQ